MKMLFDFFPIILFFIAYKFAGIYVATATAMIACVLQVSYYWFKHHRFEPLHLISLAIILILGTITLILHNAMFIKWKPTAIYWVFAVVFLATQFFGPKTLLQTMLDTKVSLPNFVWKRSNLSWALFFAAMGIANLYVVYNFSTNTWVNFKLFSLGLSVVFSIAQSIYMAKYVKS